MKTLHGLALFLFALCNPLSLLGDTSVNSWMKPTSGYWEEQSYWSLGILPDATQFVVFTNAGWKALAIGPNTAQNFPQSMQIQGLQIASPTNSYNVLLMNFSGFEVPLQTTSLSIGSNSTVVVQASILQVNTDTNGNGGNISMDPGSTFYHGDDSQVTVDGRMLIACFTSSGNVGAYYLTNGTLSVNSGLEMGGPGSHGNFVQYGGDNRVGGILSWDENNSGSIIVGVQGELDLYDGQLTATNGVLVGAGDYASTASVHQYGGSFNGDMMLNGVYYLNGGTRTGRMTVANVNQRVNASVLQTGGTNFALSLSMGMPNEFGGEAFYTLSNGLLQVDSAVPFRGGQFSQYNGQVTIASNLVMAGTDVGLGIADAEYYLEGGTLSVGGLTEQAAAFHQDAGTNVIAGDLFLMGVPPPQFGNPQTATYTLGGGLLNAKNVTVTARLYEGFRQTGGSCQISDTLLVQGSDVRGSFYYTLEGGTLTVKDIYVSPGAFFQQIGGTIAQSGVLTLNQGEWRSATNNQPLGPLQLAGQNTNSAITFPAGSSILCLANSSGQPWDSTALLCITNWHGSSSGRGATQLYFGSNSSGLTSQQLAQIRFYISGSLSPATILATGEVVPALSSTLQFSRNGGTMTLTWPSGWVLESATNVTGPYSDISGATSPWPVSTTNPQEFFRLHQ